MDKYHKTGIRLRKNKRPERKHAPDAVKTKSGVTSPALLGACRKCGERRYYEDAEVAEMLWPMGDFLIKASDPDVVHLCSSCSAFIDPVAPNDLAEGRAQ